jgi:hypothetical protein
MTDRPLGPQIDAVIARLHARRQRDTSASIREVLDEYANALTGGMLSAAWRETDRGAEILILTPGRVSIISIDFDEPAVRFETRGLRDAVVSLETTGFEGPSVGANRHWRFKFPDGGAIAIDGTLTHGQPDDLDRFAAAVMFEAGVQESARDRHPQDDQLRDAGVPAPPDARRQRVTDIWGNPISKPRRRSR